MFGIDKKLLSWAWQCKCPKCGEGSLYQSRFGTTVYDQCSCCELNFSENDSADGPAVFMIFVLGCSVVPLALLFESMFSPPLWVHAVVWGLVSIVATVGALRPVKAYVIGLQYKYRPEDWS